jgi:hypothetical protein
MPFFVGLPVGTPSFLERGVEPLLDFLRETVRVNAVIVGGHSPAGANYTPHDRYFASTFLRDYRTEAAERAGFDCFAAITEPAHQRGMEVYSHVHCYDEVPGSRLANLSHVLEHDVFGRKSFRPCLNHPAYKQYYLSLIEDQLRSYPIEGINFNIERAGPLENTLVGGYLSMKPARKPLAPTCFCPHCTGLATERGIDVHRAKQGYIALLEFAERSWRAARQSGDPVALEGMAHGDETETAAPPDGYFVTFFRLLMRYPEILAWDQLWYDNLHGLFGEIYGTVKAAGPDRKVGWHVWHLRAFSPFVRAAFDFGAMRRYSDWIKPKMDHTCGGYRYHIYSQKFAQALFPDRSPEQAYGALSAMMGWEEAPLEDLPEGGLSLEYLRRDTARLVQAVGGQVPIYPGIGLDMPSGPAGHPGFRPTEPEYVKAGLRAIVEAGAQGVVLSRSFAEMRQKNLVAAGEAIAEITAAT